MKKTCRRSWALLLMLLTAAITGQAQIEPAAQYTTLTFAQLMAWTPTGPTVVPANVSTVPLATRQNSLAPQLNPAQSFSAKVNYVPDGMNNFSGYLNEQPNFNLYNFTHWQYIDVFTWFASPVGIPCRPWIESAHRNGVKIIGTVFTGTGDVATLIQQDASGNYIAAQKLVDIANYYGFDGWFFNQETRASTTQATALINLLKQLQTIRPAGMEIHWYDAMIPNGQVAYQNTLNATNAPLLQSGTARVSDAMFTNYFWAGAPTFNSVVSESALLGRSPFDVYTGADLWPGRNRQGLFANTTWMDSYFTGGMLTTPRTSIGLFAPNLTYNAGLNRFNSDPTDYAAFYDTEVRLFSGNDLDITTADATGWKGFGYYLPVRSAINTFPFETYFCVGQGKIFANNGAVVAHSWTDMAKQSVMPSWQWAKTGAATITAGFDFSRAYYGGTSVQLAGSLAAGASTTLKLYQTKLPVTAVTNLDLIYKAATAGASNAKLALYFSDNLAVPEMVTLPALADTLWTTHTFSLSAYAGRELAIIGMQATSATAVAAYRLNLGKLKLYNGPAAPVRPVATFTANATTILTGQPVTFANASTNATSYTWTITGATPATTTAINPTVSYATAGTYSVKLRAESAVGRDSLTRTAYITVVTAPPAGSNTALLFDGVGKYVQANTLNLSGPAISLECWVKANSFKTGSPYISSLMGMEDGGSNTAELRLGDNGATSANQVEFAAQIGTATHKVYGATHLVAGTWYHVAANYDGAAMNVYVNGVLDGTLAVTGNVTANASFSLARNYANSRILDGSLDELRAWTRALTAAEIAANPCAVSGSSPGLVAYWKCNEAPGLIAADATGHGHNGNFVSMSAADWSTNVPTQCGALATVNAHQTGAGLQVLPLENPVPGARAEVELSGATGQPVILQLFNSIGALVLSQEVKLSADGAHVSLQMPAAPGVYVLQARTATSTISTRLLKQ